jgi:hypothetical protein
MPRIVIKGKGLKRAQFLNSQITNNMTNTGAPPGINMWSANPQQSQQAPNPIGWSVGLNNYLSTSAQTTPATTLPPTQFNYGRLNKQNKQQLDLARQSAQAQGITEGKDFGVGRDEKGNLVSYQDPNQAAKSNEEYQAKIDAKKGKFWKDLNNFSTKVNKGVNDFYSVINPIHDVLGLIDMEKKRKNAERAARIGNLPDNYLSISQQSAPDTRGDYDINSGMYGKQGDYVANKGQFTNATNYMPQRAFYNQNAKLGGEQVPLRIKIKSVPNTNPEGAMMEYGGQAKHSLDLRRDALVTPNVSYENPYEVTDTLKAVPRDEANVEAEKGETVFGDLDGDGGLEHMKIGGKRHHEGGTPLNLPSGAFIYSDTQKMSIKDEEVLSYFSLKPKKGGYTPAEIAKRYDVNKYKAMLEDPEADDLKKSTAQQMITAYNKKLAYLALIQESMKGFPQGIPEVSKQILGIEVDEENESSENEPPSEDEQPMLPQGKYGLMKAFEGVEMIDDTTTNPPSNVDYNINRNYQVKAKNRGQFMDYDKVGSSQYKGDKYWENKASYDANWKTHVNDVLNDPTRRDAVIANLKKASEDPNNPNAKAIKYRLQEAEKSGNFIGKVGEHATNYKIGPFHNAMRAAMDSIPTTTMAPVVDKPKVGGWICDVNNIPKHAEFASEEEKKKAGAVDDPLSLSCNKPNPLKPGKVQQIPFRPLKPDVLNLMAAGLVPPRNYQIPIKKPPFTPERAVLYDPRQALAENQSLYNTTMGALGSMGDVRTLNSMSGAMQGKALASAAGITGDYQDKNVGTLNQVLARNTEAQRQYDKEAADLATQTGFVNRDTDVFNRNQWRQYFKGIRAADTALWNNAVKMGLMNSSRKFGIDPWTGRVTMKPGAPTSMASAYSDGYGSGAHYRKMQSQFPGLTYEQYFSPGFQKAFQNKPEDDDPMLPYLMSGSFAGPYGSV